jgi:diketogulonate reductase-like aldo/keto reductase
LTANPHILTSKQMAEMCKKYKRTPSGVFYRALTQINIIPLIGTTSGQHMKEDLSIFEFEVEENDMNTIQKFFD